MSAAETAALRQFALVQEQFQKAEALIAELARLNAALTCCRNRLQRENDRLRLELLRRKMAPELSRALRKASHA
jgi:hypothetical protein